MQLRPLFAASVAAYLAVACGPAPGPVAPQPAPSTPQGAPAPPLKLVRRYGTNDLRHGESVRRAVFLGDGGPIASAGPDGVRVWDVAGHPLAFLEAATDITALPGMGMLAVARGTAVIAYTIEGGEAKEAWRHDVTGEVVPFGLEARGGKLVVALRDRVLVLNPATGNLLSRSAALPWLADARGVAIAPDGKTIVVRHTRATQVHSIEHPDAAPIKLGDVVWGFVVTRDSHTAIGVSRAVTGGETSGVRAWDLASGEVRWSVPAGSMDPPAIGVSPDGTRVVTASEADGIAVRDARTGAVVRKLAPLDASWKVFDLNEPSIAAFTPDGQRLAWGAREDVRLWDVAAGREVLPEGGRPPACRGLSEDGKWTVIGDEVWDIDRDAAVVNLRSEMGEGLDFYIQWSFGPAPSRLCAAWPASLLFWDLGDRSVKRAALEGWAGGAMSCSAHTAMLVEVSVGMAEIWREAPPGRVAQINRNGIYSSSDDSYFPAPSASRDRFALPLREAVEVFDADSGASLFKVPVPGGSRAVALSKDDRWLAVARPGGAEVWDLQAWKVAHALASPSPTSVAFVAGGAWLAVGRTDGMLDLWDLAGGARLTGLSAHHGRVRELAAGGARLVSYGTDGTCALWEVSAPP